MKNYVITIDTGTTNTRVILWDREKRILARADSEVGAHCTAMDGNNARLKTAVRTCLQEALKKAGTSWDEVSQVLASGMLTSDMGLLEIPHISVPAGKKELAAAIREVLLPEICPLPIRFIPGVKNSSAPVNYENFEAMDIMRGEEVEAVALLQQFPAGKAYVIVLPGSHMKFVSTDEEGRITGCLTSISGELLSAITLNTLLADAVDRKFVSPEDYDREMLLLGYRTAKMQGIGRACFSCRILNQFVEKNKAKLANYLLGAALQSDVTALLHSSALTVNRESEIIIAGKDPLRRAFTDILEEEGCFAFVHGIVPDAEKPLSALGALEVGETKKKNYQLIGFDMDGTLLNSEKQVTPDTVQAIREAVAAGKTVVYCTGRSPSEMSFFREGLPEIRYAICNNGATIWDMKEWKEVFSDCLSKEIIRRLLKAVQGMPHVVQIYSGEDIVYDDYSEEKVIMAGMGEYLPMYRKIARSMTGFEASEGQMDVPVNKLSIHLTSIEERERFRKKAEALKLPVEARSSNHFTLEFNSEGVTKAYGLRQIGKLLNIPLSACIAVGDGGNDIDALREAGLGIAVGNATEELKKIAGAVVSDNDHDGCAEAIRKYLLGESRGRIF